MSTNGPRRRTLLGLGAAAGKAPRPGFAAAFASPGRAVRPTFRWWWPDGLVDPAEIAREVDQIADAGFGGVEVAAVTHSVSDQLSDPMRTVRSGVGCAHRGGAAWAWRWVPPTPPRSSMPSVEVATTLLNRPRTVRPAEFGAAKRQRYGLIGPVRLVPYGRAAVPAGS